MENFACIFVNCRFFSKSTFFKKSFKNTIRVSNSLDPDQARHIVGPDLGPNCLRSLSADDSSRQRGKFYAERIMFYLFKVFCYIFTSVYMLFILVNRICLILNLYINFNND